MGPLDCEEIYCRVSRQVPGAPENPLRRVSICTSDCLQGLVLLRAATIQIFGPATPVSLFEGLDMIMSGKT